MTNRTHLHPAHRPNPSVPAITPADDAARGDVLKLWAGQWGTDDELLLLASSRSEARTLNTLARSALRSAGHLRGPAVAAGELELTPGDRVVTGPNGIGRPGGLGIPPGCPGDVRLVNPSDGSAVIDFPTSGVMRLSRTCLERASLTYGYAVPAPPGQGRPVAGIRLAHPAHLGAEIA